MLVMAPRPPAVTCDDCDRVWNSATLADGLRLIGSCPRCGGSLTFHDQSADAPSESTPPAGQVRVAPHLVLGIPRR